MRIDFSKELTDLEGNPIKETIDENSKAITLRKVCVNALMANEDKIEGTEKLKRYQLATKIQKGTMEVSAEDITLIKSLVGKFYGTVIVGQVYEIFESN